MMPLVSRYARWRKLGYFLSKMPRESRILEVGGADGWVGDYLRHGGWNYYVNVDLALPADVVGDVRDWRRLGLRAGSFDVIIAFEVVEHVDCWQECYDLLKPGGKLFVTTPVPRMDWLLKLFELVGLNQKRTSTHNHLVYLRDIKIFQQKSIKTVGCLAQWAVFTK